MSAQSQDIIWRPQGPYLNCRAEEFIKLHGLSDWRELIERSTDDIEWFWQAALDFMGFQWTRSYSQLLDDSAGLPWSRWFVGGQLNIADNCLDWHMTSGKMAGSRRSAGKDQPALIWEAENGLSRTLTYERAQRDGSTRGRVLDGAWHQAW